MPENLFFIEISSNSPLQKVPKDYALRVKFDHWFIIPNGPDANKKMFYYDYKPKEAYDEIVLFVHGSKRQVLQILQTPIWGHGYEY